MPHIPGTGRFTNEYLFSPQCPQPPRAFSLKYWLGMSLSSIRARSASGPAVLSLDARVPLDMTLSVAAPAQHLWRCLNVSVSALMSAKIRLFMDTIICKCAMAGPHSRWRCDQLEGWVNQLPYSACIVITLVRKTWNLSAYLLIIACFMLKRHFCVWNHEVAFFLIWWTGHGSITCNSFSSSPRWKQNWHERGSIIIKE